MSEPFEPLPAEAPVEPAPDAEPQPAVSPAVQRFESCRWRQVAEDATPAHCTHRDVVSIAGVQSFNPDAWCQDCTFYKVKRTPRKRPTPPPQDRYYY